MSDPKKTQAQAYQEAYNVGEMTKRASIDVQASATLRKPAVISYLANYNDLVENTLINTVNDWGREDNTRKREIAVNTAQFLHDKIHGKSTQKIQQSTEVVQISINLTGDKEKPPIDL
jgi:hypothetical protein